MDSFEMLKKASTASSFLKFDDFEIGKRYLVDRFEFLTDTKYGVCLVVYVNDDLVYLPKRFTKVFTSAAAVESLNKDEYVLIYSGRDATKNNKILVDFDLAGPDDHDGKQ